MTDNSYLFTSESVTEGHPDKICDQISDAILDEVIKLDRNGRVACETLTTRGLIFVAGEITTDNYVDIPDVARNLIKETGYTDTSYGFHYNDSAIITSIQNQSPDIALGVDKGGAGDQGMMFGYATDETPELMPLPISLAHRLVRQLSFLRKNNELDYLRPDGKSQVTVLYRNNIPCSVESVVLSTQHDPEAKHKKIVSDLTEFAIDKIIPADLRGKKMKVFVNPTGRFVIGGPQADTGVTGRKIIVDTYGGYGRHGGGAFSGKDPSKVDRSGAYMARYAAKNIVAAGAADKCEIQVAYSIGVAKPVSVHIETFGTEKVAVEKIEKAVLATLDFRPAAIIDKLNLRRPVYSKTASYGHFGRDDADFTWEKTDKAAALKKALGL